MIRATIMSVLLCAIASVQALAAECTRQTLQSVTDSYVDALRKGSPR